MQKILAFLLLFYCLLFAVQGFSQEKEKKKWKPFSNIKRVFEQPFSSQEIDTSIVHTDMSPLDIASDRGLFILSPDRMMQMRILGSVRANFAYSSKDLENRSTLSPYEIPTVFNQFTPNFNADLNQTRLGFEITRRTSMGDLFIRIEADFNNQVNSFRIRHAYGQLNKMLFGQTWSVFSNVSYVPATVSSDGPPGSIYSRNPQIRYSSSLSKDIDWIVGIEYSRVDVFTQDTISTYNGKLLQVIPDVTGRIKYQKDNLNVQVSGILSTISVQNTVDQNIDYSLGFGLSASGIYTLANSDNIYFSYTAGRAISHYLAVFSGKGEDASFDASRNNFDANIATAAHAAYERKLKGDLTASVSGGFASIRNRDFQPNEAFNWGYNVLANLFWQPVDGARLGFEFGHGTRWDHREARGSANRVGLLLYYDF